MATYNNEGFKIMGNILISYDKNFDTTPESVVIPEQVEIIGYNSFYDQQLGGPLTFGSQTKWILQNAFYYTNFVGNITLPNQLKYISSYAFAYSNLTQINLPASLRVVENSAFDTNTLVDVTIENPEQLDISYEAFGYYSDNRNELRPVYKNNFVNNAVIIDGVFLRYYGYDKQYSIPEGVVNIVADAFDYRDDTVRSITLPSTLKYIARDAFEGLDLLGLIDFSNVISLNYIGSNILGRTRVQNVIITAPITTIHPEAFRNMSHLAELDLNMVNPVNLELSLVYDLYD
jgi:hypothetical protein